MGGMTLPNESSHPPSPVPGSVLSLLELFGEELEGVKFPDVDAEVLESAANQLVAEAAKVAEAEAALDAARQRFQDSHEALLQKAHRALSYARVFAEEDAELAAKLEALALPRSQRRARVELSQGTDAAAPRRRGRPPKTATSPNLFQQVPEVSEEAVVAEA